MTTRPTPERLSEINRIFTTTEGYNAFNELFAEIDALTAERDEIEIRCTNLNLGTVEVQMERDQWRAAYEKLREALELQKILMFNLMQKGNIDWGKTFGIDFGLMNKVLILQDKALALPRPGETFNNNEKEKVK